MIALTVAALAVAAALVQVGPLSLFTVDAIASPLLPIAVVAGWGVARRADETWLALLLAPVVFGAVSQDRVGVFVIALWPTAAFALLARQSDRDPAGYTPRRLVAAAAAAAAGAACYVTLLAVAGGHVASIATQARTILVAIAITAVAATAVAVAVWPWRPRRRGLFE